MSYSFIQNSQPDVFQCVETGEWFSVLPNTDGSLHPLAEIYYAQKQAGTVSEVSYTLDRKSGELYGLLADKRWAVETGGTSWNGLAIATDDRSKTLITGAKDRAAVDSSFSTRWKVGPGQWATIDAATILAIYAATFAWVDACFSREEELSRLISNAGSMEELDALAPAIAKFWP